MRVIAISWYELQALSASHDYSPELPRDKKKAANTETTYNLQIKTKLVVSTTSMKHKYLVREIVFKIDFRLKNEKDYV